MPSQRSLIVSALIASTGGVLVFPFLFDAFGLKDNPFDRPAELVWIALLALAFFLALLLVGVLRRTLSAAVGSE